MIGRARLLPSPAIAASSAASSSDSGPTCITRVQFAQSRLATSSRIGEPSVRPWRTPDEDPGPVLLDHLPGAAPVAALAPCEVDRQVVLGQREAGRHPFDHGAQHGAVALAGCDEPEAVHVRFCSAAGVRPGRARATRARPRPR